MIELCARYRCDTCGVAVEIMGLMGGPVELPATVEVKVGEPPTEWSVDADGKVACVQHRRLVVPVVAGLN